MPIIGREPPADIVVPAPQVSARHAEIRNLGNGYYELTDLGSSNGTYVNGQRVQRATVRVTDRVSLGSFVIDLSAFTHLIPGPRPIIGPQGSLVQPASPKPVSNRGGESGGTPKTGRKKSAPRRQKEIAKADPPPVVDNPRNVGQPGMGTDLAVALAAQKTYGSKAFFVFFLYWLLWLPGFIMNMVYLSEAKNVQRMTGQSPSGMGCLWLLLIVYVVLPVVVILVVVLGGGAFLSSILH